MAQDDEISSPEDGVPVESLIQGRAKRSTAGQHMSALLDAEADDELALLFEEIEDDNEFAADVAEEGGEEEDMGLESSSDDEDDQGPTAQADELEGERQIEKDEREEKKKKRVREDLRYRITSKKVKIDPTAAAAPTTPAPRPRKKSERVSWIPTVDEGPTRSSSRRQTMQNKELTHARLKDSEEKRVRLIATMEEAAKRKAKHKPKKLSQAEHLAEAERVEKHNSKSLNRWEEMEKRKAEERRAKIEALQNRRLEGPVISYWSGVATWADGRLTRLGKVNVTPKLEKEEGARKKSKKADKEGKNEIERKPSNAAAELGIAQMMPPSANPAGPTSTDEPKLAQVSAQPVPQAAVDSGQEKHINTEGAASINSSDPVSHLNTASEPPLSASAHSILPDSQTADNVTKETPGETEGNGVADEQPKEVTGNGTTKATTDNLTSQLVKAPATKDSKLADAEVAPQVEEKPSDVVQEPVPQLPATPQKTSEPRLNSPPPVAPISPQPHQQPDGQGSIQTPVQTEQKPDIHIDQPNAADPESPQPAAPSHPSVVEHTGRCLTVLENFDDKTAQSRDFNIYFNAKKPPRLTKISSSLCVITSLPSRYRDPDTSLAFANSYAYHEIRHIAAQKYSWSPMLGCYVAPAGVAARGVPERFLNPNAEESSLKDTGTDEEPNAPAKEETAKTGGSSALTTPTPTAPPAATPAAAAGAGDLMDIDK
ncbi:YL1 nuclear protein-domain-containing protein [Aspergillus cavernicola]|uniref:YL1 nuclear protein-domain-containing protein n=1 Tax=Aspergillus cavernicola TaxID=176166 RepID=A0ABR4HWM1_9EURO